MTVGLVNQQVSIHQDTVVSSWHHRGGGTSRREAGRDRTVEQKMVSRTPFRDLFPGEHGGAESTLTKNTFGERFPRSHGRAMVAPPHGR
jgi:hypothetical protein